MKQSKENVTTVTKLTYETPKVEAKKIELEYGVAAGSNAPQQQWKDSKTVNEEVENYYW